MPKNQTTRRAFNFAADQAWAILEESFENILAIAQRENDAEDVKTRIEAVEKKLGRPLMNTQDVTVRDGVAVIPVMGPIFRYANLFTQISGAASVEVMARDFNAALEDPAVKAIMLNIDSPGGMVSGISEFANHIYEARGQKPVVAYVADFAASAAYWIASAADEIITSDTGKLGSIGAVISYRKGEDPNIGKIISSQSPYKQADPNNAEGRGKVQAMVDSLAGVFIDAVARNRGVSQEVVLSDFGQGGLFVGSDAVTAGLADGVGSYEGVIAMLSGSKADQFKTGYSISRINQKGAISMTTEPTTTTPVTTEITTPPVAAAPAAPTQPAITAEYVKSNYPAVAQALQAEGATAERTRIQGVEAKGQLIPGHEALIAELKFDGKTTPAEASERILAAEGRVRTDAHAAAKADAPAPLPQPASNAVEPTAAEQPGVFSEEACKAQFEKDAKLQAEFGTVGAYTAFKKAEVNGQALIMHR